MNFVILGAGQIGRLVAEIAARSPGLNCVGFLDPDPKLVGTEVHGVKVLGDDGLLESISVDPAVQGALPVMGNLPRRRQLFQTCLAAGLALPAVIDPTAVLASDVQLGEGVCMLINTSALTNSNIGNYAFVGTGVSVLHDVTIGENCVIGGGSIIGSGTHVGDDVEFGVGVTIASGGFRIGSGARIAAGAVIHKDVPDSSFVIGNPARVIGKAE